VSPGCAKKYPDAACTSSFVAAIMIEPTSTASRTASSEMMPLPVTIACMVVCQRDGAIGVSGSASGAGGCGAGVWVALTSSLRS